MANDCNQLCKKQSLTDICEPTFSKVHKESATKILTWSCKKLSSRVYRNLNPMFYLLASWIHVLIYDSWSMKVYFHLNLNFVLSWFLLFKKSSHCFWLKNQVTIVHSQIMISAEQNKAIIFTFLPQKKERIKLSQNWKTYRR